MIPKITKKEKAIMKKETLDAWNIFQTQNEIIRNVESCWKTKLDKEVSDKIKKMVENGHDRQKIMSSVCRMLGKQE